MLAATASLFSFQTVVCAMKLAKSTPGVTCELNVLDRALSPTHFNQALQIWVVVGCKGSIAILFAASKLSRAAWKEDPKFLMVSLAVLGTNMILFQISAGDLSWAGANCSTKSSFILLQTVSSLSILLYQFQSMASLGSSALASHFIFPGSVVMSLEVQSLSNILNHWKTDPMSFLVLKIVDSYFGRVFWLSLEVWLWT